MSLTSDLQFKYVARKSQPLLKGSFLLSSRFRDPIFSSESRSINSKCDSIHEIQAPLHTIQTSTGNFPSQAVRNKKRSLSLHRLITEAESHSQAVRISPPSNRANFIFYRGNVVSKDIPKLLEPKNPEVFGGFSWRKRARKESPLNINQASPRFDSILEEENNSPGTPEKDYVVFMKSSNHFPSMRSPPKKTPRQPNQEVQRTLSLPKIVLETTLLLTETSTQPSEQPKNPHSHQRNKSEVCLLSPKRNQASEMNFDWKESPINLRKEHSISQIVDPPLAHFLRGFEKNRLKNLEETRKGLNQERETKNLQHNMKVNERGLRKRIVRKNSCETYRIEDVIRPEVPEALVLDTRKQKHEFDGELNKLSSSSQSDILSAISRKGSFRWSKLKGVHPRC